MRKRRWQRRCAPAQNSEADTLEEPEYTVILCCSGRNFTYSSNNDTPVENDTCTVAE